MATFLVSKVVQINTFFVYATKVWLTCLALTPCAVSELCSTLLFVNLIQHILLSVSSNYHWKVSSTFEIHFTYKMAFE